MLKNVSDIANYFLTYEPISKQKLQQLCYLYSGWALALNRKTGLKCGVFVTSENGPINASLKVHLDEYEDDIVPIFENELEDFTEQEYFVLNIIWNTYGSKSEEKLTKLNIDSAPYQYTYNHYGLYQPIDRYKMETYFKKQKEDLCLG